MIRSMPRDFPSRNFKKSIKKLIRKETNKEGLMRKESLRCKMRANSTNHPMRKMTL